jgi:hypothetical protein
MKITESTSLRDVAFAVCTALHRAGVTAVLTGGSAATVYAPDAYQSRDLDFIVEFRSAGADARGALIALGYRLVGDHYEHNENSLDLEFPKGPLAVGGDLIREWETLQDGDLLLHIIKPTDCCRDRLAGFLFWNDRGSLDQAVAVARAQRDMMDVGAVESWCESEGHSGKFAEFERALDASG